MKDANWKAGIQGSVEPERASPAVRQLLATEAGTFLAGFNRPQVNALCQTVAASPFLASMLVAHPRWCEIFQDLDRLRFPRRKEGFQRELKALIGSRLAFGDSAGVFALVREFKQRAMLRVAVRDLNHWATLPEIIGEISDLADVCVDTVYQVCLAQAVRRWGRPYHREAQGNWTLTDFCLLALGKLGGQELNYSSDIDLMFVYSEEGNTFKTPPETGSRPRGGVTNHPYFNWLAEGLVRELSRPTRDGQLYRVDLRLRPEGPSGPLCRSLASCENYYAQWGQTWERMMLIKARRVAGSPALENEFIETLQSFRYPRFLGNRIVKEVADLKHRIEAESRHAQAAERNIKLGRGGIREVEFVVQTLQILNAGKLPFLQDSKTLSALDKLVRYDLLESVQAKQLSEAYCFFRALEHRLQMEENQQTHTLPGQAPAQARIGRLLGFDQREAFLAALDRHRARVRAVYDQFIETPSARAKPGLPEVQNEKSSWQRLLRSHGFRDVDQAYRLVLEFVSGPGFVHVSPHTHELAYGLLRHFLRLCPKPVLAVDPRTIAARPDEPRNARDRERIRLSDPDRVITRLESYIAAYGARALLYETWSSNPDLFKLILLLFDRSEFLAEAAIRTPDLVESLQLGGQLRRKKGRDELIEEIRYGEEDEDQKRWLRKYFQSELMRIGLRSILDLSDDEQTHQEISALAEAFLDYTLRIARRAHPGAPPLAIVGLGKLGGAELSFGSDLDLLFVADCRLPDLGGPRQIARRVLQLLRERTALGQTFDADARLRPDGASGPLVNTLEAYERYYHNRAQLWEIQALTRARVVAGDEAAGNRFQCLAARLTDFRRPPEGLAAYSPGWKHAIAAMRARIEHERTPRGKDPLALKTGRGGLMDAEFLAQTFCLENGWREPNTLRALTRIQESRAMPESDAATLIESYRNLRHLEAILRRWSLAGETVLPDQPEPLKRVALRAGFHSAEDLLNATSAWRSAIRAVYRRVLAPPENAGGRADSASPA